MVPSSISVSNVDALASRQPRKFFRCDYERRTSRLARLALRVDKGHIRKTNESENVTQVGFLKIKLLPGRPLA